MPVLEGWAQEQASGNLAAFEAWEACARPTINLGKPMLVGRSPPPGLPGRGRPQGRDERIAICSQPGLAPCQIEDED